MKILTISLISYALLRSIVIADPSDGVAVVKDVDYLGPDRTEKLDVYLPAKSFGRPLPAVLLIHGGGWRVGDKASSRERSIAKDLASEGFAVFSINYKLNVGSRDAETRKFTLSYLAWPQNLYDCKTALRFIRANADQYGIDPDSIAIMGGSAGGHLAMMVASTANDPEWNDQGLFQDQDNSVAAVVNFYGEYDVREQKVSPFMGASKEQMGSFTEAEASPVIYFDNELPPMLIVHGTADSTIPVERSRELVEFLREEGFVYEYVEIPEAPHSFNLQPDQMDLRPVVVEFLNEHLGD
tara:strand:- start:1368 stop:2258 length:891 start_codon:yes stop_codon:yes gene_type:complete